MSTTNDFRGASGLEKLAAAEDVAADDPPRGPGLFEVARANGERAITNVRRLAGCERAPGSRVIAVATWLLVLLGAGLMFVTLPGPVPLHFQRQAGAPRLRSRRRCSTLGMVILSALGSGLALAGKPSKAERVLIMACAGLSAS